MRKTFLLLLVIAATAAAGDSYWISPDQLKQLQADQKTVERAYSRFVTAQQELQAAQGKMQGDAERIKQANGWPADTAFRGDTLTFYPAPPAPPRAVRQPQPEGPVPQPMGPPAKTP